MGWSIKNLFLTVVLLLSLAGCKGEPGKSFEISAEDVFSKLLSGDMPREIRSKQYSEMGEHERIDYDYDAGTITWRRVWKDREYYRYHARIIAKDEGTSRVMVEFFPGESLSKQPKASQKMTYGAVAERIYSHLEGRQYDGLKVQRYSMAYIAVNPTETLKDINGLAEQAKAEARKSGIAVPD